MKNLVEKPKDSNSASRHAVLTFLNARVSFPSWMLAINSMITAYISLGLLLFATGGLGAFGAALPFSGYLWAPLLTASTTATVVGLLWIERVIILRYGAFVSFCMWTLAGISFVIQGELISLVVFGLPFMLFYAYVYLASFFRDKAGI